MDESFCLPWCRAELNWKLLFIPPVCRRRIRFVCNWFKPRGGLFCVGKATVFLLMEEMIEFVLSCMCLCLLSSHPLLVSVNQIIALPLSTHAPCWAVKVNLQMLTLIFCFFSSLSSSFACVASSHIHFFFLPPAFWGILTEALPFCWVFSFLRLFAFYFLPRRFYTSLDKMMKPISIRWCLVLFQSNAPPHLTMLGFGPWLRRACQLDFLCRRADCSLRASCGKMATESLFIIQKLCSRSVRNSPSAAVHLCSHSSLVWM